LSAMKIDALSVEHVNKSVKETWLAGQKLEMLIDLQNSIKSKDSPGYAHWAKVFSLKQAAKTLLFLQENNLTDMKKLQYTSQNAKDDFNALQSEIRAIDNRLEQISTLQKHIRAYRKTKDIYAQYGKITLDKIIRKWQT